MSKTIFYILLVLTIFFVNCDSKNKSEDTQANRNQLLLILYYLNQHDFTAHCLSAQDSALTCADNASLRALYIAAVESAYEITIPSPQQSLQICESVNAAASISSFSNGARSCLFQCQRGYWINGQNNGSCNATDYSQLLTDSVTQVNTCFEDCLKGSTQFIF